LKISNKQAKMEGHQEYYSKRAEAYEQIYRKPERQDDLGRMKAYLENQFRAKSLIELGCGTGYWTEVLAKNCLSIFAIDINQEVIDIAQKKYYPHQNVRFAVLDLNGLHEHSASYDGLFAGFIWSHVKKEKLPHFIKICHEQIHKDAELIFMDNRYVTGSSTPISRMDAAENTYQIRRLSSGATYEVVKNFPDKEAFMGHIKPYFELIEWLDLPYYWIAKCKPVFNKNK